MDNGTLMSPPLQTPISPPSWSMLFALILVIILMGFFVMYLIFRMSRQEKMIEVLNKRTQEIPTPSDVVELIHECYGSPQFQQPMMRNIHSIIETRLNDFDSYCKEKYGKDSSLSHTPPTTELSNQHANDDHTMPALDEKEHGEDASANVSNSVNSSHSANVSNSANVHSAHTVVHQNPSPMVAQIQPRQENRSSGNGGSILAEAIPSLLSMFTGGGGGGSATQLGGDVTFPVIIGDIMTLMNNQQVRQRRRERMAPSEPPPSTSNSSSPPQPPATTESS